MINQQEQNDRNQSEFSNSSFWWSNFISECNDDEVERISIESSTPLDDDLDDDDHSLLFELWPMIQNREQIPFVVYQILYRRIQNRLHLLSVPHPMKKWAKETIFQLSDDDYETSWNIFQLKQKHATKCLSSTMIGAPNRLYASHLWLNQLTNVPERFVGILLENPIYSNKPREIHRQESLLDNNNDNIETALNLPRFYQSCLPNTCLELYVIADQHEFQQISSLAVKNKQTCVKIFCRWVALYDISEVELKKKSITLSTIPKSSNCKCFRCLYEKGKTRTESVKDLCQAQRLAHSYFQKEKYRDALELYQRCYRLCLSLHKGYTTTDTDVVVTEGNIEWLLRIEADLFYNVGAIYLSQRKFSLAQQHWKNGTQYINVHEELSKQLTKQRAYQYFHPEFRKLNETIKPTQRSLYSAKQPIFNSSNIIDVATCRKLIQWALEYASNNGGWTNDRHYSVPTTDIPLHLVPNLLEWFKGWMTQVLLPTLENQFAISNGDGQQQRFYVHDAFLVRYEASTSNHFLPLHYDESTHSCVCSLNDDFAGGGSYVYSLNRSIVPPTGGMVSFLGNRCLHGGSPVTSGVRYILAIFLYLDGILCCSTYKENRKKSFSFSSISKGEKRRPDVMGEEDYQNSKRIKIHGGQGEGFSFSFF